MGKVVNTLGIRIGALMAAIYFFVCTYWAYLIVVREKIDAISMIALVSFPSSLIVSEIGHFGTSVFFYQRDKKMLMDLVGLLGVGAVQFFLVGYIFGALVSVAIIRLRNR